jgi:hypothetical protein
MNVAATFCDFSCVNKSEFLEIGEVKKQKAYLYGKKYEVFVECLANRKVVSLEINKLNGNERELVLKEVGTVSFVLSVAAGYIANH